jgi:hypothetical protein
MSIFGTLSAIYVIPTIYNEYRSLERVGHSLDSDLQQKPVAPLDRLDSDIVRLSTLNVDAFAQKAIDVVRSKANALHLNTTVSCDYLHCAFIVVTVFNNMWRATAKFFFSTDHMSLLYMRLFGEVYKKDRDD